MSLAAISIRYRISSNTVWKLSIKISIPHLANLGPAIRKNLNRHRNRLERDFPSFSYRVRWRDEIDEQTVRAIVKLNWARMAGKGEVSGFDERKTQRLISLARTHGFVLEATIDGRICAGAICFCIGTHYFMQLSTDDPAYDSYRLGMLCCYLAIQKAIQDETVAGRIKGSRWLDGANCRRGWQGVAVVKAIGTVGRVSVALPDSTSTLHLA